MGKTGEKLKFYRAESDDGEETGPASAGGQEPPKGTVRRTQAGFTVSNQVARKDFWADDVWAETDGSDQWGGWGVHSRQNTQSGGRGRERGKVPGRLAAVGCGQQSQFPMVIITGPGGPGMPQGQSLGQAQPRHTHQVSPSRDVCGLRLVAHPTAPE